MGRRRIITGALAVAALAAGGLVMAGCGGADGTPASTTKDGLAKAPRDYKRKSGTITFIPGDTREFVFVKIWPEDRNETSENFKVKLSNPINATISDEKGKGTITDRG